MRTTVVVVDDGGGFRGRARVLLDANGVDVVGEAADGRQAREILRRLHPQVVLMDVGLPAGRR